jgi:hypothetical protein
MDKKETILIRTGSSLSWEEREEMIKEYLRGNWTKTEVWEKYTGQGEEHGQILSWMRKLGYISDKKSTLMQKRSSTGKGKITAPMDDDMSKTEPIALEKRIEELEKQLENVQLKLKTSVQMK